MKSLKKFLCSPLTSKDFSNIRTNIFEKSDSAKSIVMSIARKFFLILKYFQVYNNPFTFGIL